MKIICIVLVLFAGCKTTSVFVTPNEVNKVEVTLQYINGSKQSGELTILHENFNSKRVSYDEFVDFKADGKTNSEKVNLYSLKGYWYKNDYYALKKLDIRLTDEYRLLFAKRLTPDSSRIHLYELRESGDGNNVGEPGYSYYISLADYSVFEAINARSIQLMPNFEQKMSLIVADCPALAKKIQSRQKGYFIPQATLNIKKVPDVMLTIISEYNQCH